MKFSPRHVAAFAALALLAACGGGGSKVDPFVPERLLSFGDEASLLTPDGKRYGVNGTKTVSEVVSFDCTANAIWNQQLATSFGLVLQACNPDNKPVTSRVYAQLGAKVADVRTQIDQHLAGGSVGPKDLITIYAGTHDIVELYRQYPAQTASQLIAAAGQRGRELAQQANRLANANGRVLLLSLVNVGSTPFALKEKAANTDTDRAALLRDMSTEFTRLLRLTLINDGRLVGLVLADERIGTLTSFPSAFGLVNIKDGACASALPDCSTSTLVTGAELATWLWADDLRLSAIGQNELAREAVTRAANNPF